MENSNADLWEESINSLQKCKNTLTEISKTCCMPERSPNIKEAQLVFDDLILTTKKIQTDKSNIEICINTLGGLGSKIGYLYATCCTATREPMYQSIFKELMHVHANMWKGLGHAH